MPFKFGDPVWYRQTCRGGYGFQRDVPAVFVCQHAKRASIRVHALDGSKKQIAVDSKNLRLREQRG